MPAGPQLDLPHDVTPKQLETLLNGLLKQEEKLPYSFFVNEQQLSQELGSHLLQHKVSLVSQSSSPMLTVNIFETSRPFKKQLGPLLLILGSFWRLQSPIRQRCEQHSCMQCCSSFW